MNAEIEEEADFIPLTSERARWIGQWTSDGHWPQDISKQKDRERTLPNINLTFTGENPPRLPHALSQWTMTRPKFPSLLSAVASSRLNPIKDIKAVYRNPLYPFFAHALGPIYMNESELGITDYSINLCQSLLKEDHDTPKNTIFSSDLFRKAMYELSDRNEARVIQDLSRLLVPSPETLEVPDVKGFGVLTKSVSECWDKCVPIMTFRPQPDFAVGFRKTMFSDAQFNRLSHYIADVNFNSSFMATTYLFFPFLTCEVDCDNDGLDLADRQNAHNMFIGVKGIVHLSKLVRRETELHRRILTFSISHNARTVRIYGYYPVIGKFQTRVYRHLLRTFDLDTFDGRERWTTYKFTIGVYQYSLALLRTIRSFVDDLPAFPDPMQPKKSEHTRHSEQSYQTRRSPQSMGSLERTEDRKQLKQPRTSARSHQSESPVEKSLVHSPVFSSVQSSVQSSVHSSQQSLMQMASQTEQTDGPKFSSQQVHLLEQTEQSDQPKHSRHSVHSQRLERSAEPSSVHSSEQTTVCLLEQPERFVAHTEQTDQRTHLPPSDQRRQLGESLHEMPVQSHQTEQSLKQPIPSKFQHFGHTQTWAEQQENLLEQKCSTQKRKATEPISETAGKKPRMGLRDFNYEEF